MTDLQTRVLEYASLNKSVNEIVHSYGIPEEDLIRVLSQLENKGMEIKRNYDDNGNVILSPNRDYKEKGPVISTDSHRIKFVLKSDTHYGSQYERPDLDDIVMNFAVANGYHLMIHLGDFVNGVSSNPNVDACFRTSSGRLSRHTSNIQLMALKQLKHALMLCPRDKSVIQFMILGNHDYYVLENSGINIGTIIKKSGFDLVPIGFEKGRIGVGKDFIGLYHRIGSKANPDASIVKVTLCGHTHRFRVEVTDDGIVVFVPAISDINIYDSFLGQGFALMEVVLNNKKEITEIVVDHMVFDANKKPIIASESEFQYRKK